MTVLAKEVARKQINHFSMAASGYALVPIPGHSVVLTVAEAKMAANIARIYGVKPYGVVWTALLKLLMLKLGGSALLKAVSEGLTFTPIVGWLAKSVIAGGIMKGFGETLIAYFQQKFPNQPSYQKPPLTSMVAAFGSAVALHELTEYYHSYSSTSHADIEA